MPGAYLLRFPDTSDVIQLATAYDQDPHVQYSEPNAYIQPDIIPNDSLFGLQWAHNSTHMKSELGWTIAPGYSNVIVQINDYGVDWMHPDLDANIWINSDEDINHNGKFDTLWVTQGGDRDGIDQDSNGYKDDVGGWNFYSNDWRSHCDPLWNFDPPLKNDHGDYCAGTSCEESNNISGAAGTNWLVKIMIARTLSRQAAIAGIDYAVDKKADIINISWHVTGDYQDFHDAIDSAYARGLVLVASAGNDPYEVVFYPAGYEHVIAAAATEGNDVKTSYSSWGEHVDLSAPGNNWVPGRKSTSEWNVFTYKNMDGTSISAPFVSGLAALIKDQYLKLWGSNPITNSQIETVLDSSCDSIYHLPGNAPYVGKLGSGRINTFKALLAISRGEVNNDHKIDLSDVIYLAYHVFGKPGYDPIPVKEMGDVNCDGVVNLGDVVYLDHYVFGQFPKPLLCFKYKYPWN